VLQAERIVRESPIVKSAHLNYVGTFATTDPYFGRQWALRNIEAQKGWDGYTKGNASVIVAILDSGFTPHEELSWGNPRVIQDPSRYNFTDDPSYLDEHDHAMGVAGVIASETDNATGIAGVAWYSRLWFIKVGTSEDGEGMVTCDWLARGMNCVVDSAIVFPNNRYIINASIGIPAPDNCMQIFEDAVARADSNNVLIIASSGNTTEIVGKPDEFYVQFPALFSRRTENSHCCNVISVGAVDSVYNWAEYSNYLGTDTCEVYVDLSAPGGVAYYQGKGRIVTLSSSGYSAYKNSYGTSYSSAHVSGAAALVWSLNPYLTPHEVKNILKTTAFDPSDTLGFGYKTFSVWCYDPEDPPPIGRVLPAQEPLGHTFYQMCDEPCLYEYNRKKGTGILNIYNALTRVRRAYVHGLVTRDVTWSGNIYVLGDITVAEGVTLTIKAGTTVGIARSDYEMSGEDPQKVEILVKGTLIAGESGGSGICFKADLPDDATSRTWVGITIDSMSTGSVLRNVEIRHARRAIRNYASVELRGCTIGPSNFTTIELHGNARIDSSEIYLTCDTEIESGDTLRVEGNSKLYVSPADSSNVFYDSLKVEFLCGGRLVIEGDGNVPVEIKSYGAEPAADDWRGLEISGSNASGSLTYCTILNGYHGIKSWKPLYLSHCTITNCEVYGIYLQGAGLGTSQIVNCVANGNGAAGIMISASSGASISECDFNGNYRGICADHAGTLTVDHSRLKYNSCDGMRAANTICNVMWCTVEDNDQQGINLFDSYGSVANTKIWKNTANGLYCYGSWSMPCVEYTKIEQNAVGVRVAGGARPVLGDTDLEMGQHNSIYNQPTFVYGSPSYTIMAENCWWGTEPGALPDPNKFKGIVDFNPFLEIDPVHNLASPPPKLPPPTFALSQNFPNPFRREETTAIKYWIPEECASVTIVIYDVLGRRVKTLVDAPRGAGEYAVRWDGRNDRGATVAAGIYFYRLAADRKMVARKMIFVR
jgi:parallel beta-helix repeat protein